MTLDASLHAFRWNSICDMRGFSRNATGDRRSWSIGYALLFRKPSDLEINTIPRSHQRQSILSLCNEDRLLIHILSPDHNPEPSLNIYPFEHLVRFSPHPPPILGITDRPEGPGDPLHFKDELREEW